MAQRAIVIANTGSPSAPTPEAVRDYLGEFLTDPRICPMNPRIWGIILKCFILPKRSKASARKYRMIWTPDGSPLELIMHLLAVRLQDRFDTQDGVEASNDGERKTLVRYAMSYGSPSVNDTLCELRDAGVEDLVVVPLYPQGAYSTVSVVGDKVDQALTALDWQLNLRFVDHYSQRPDYIEAVARSILQAGFDPASDKLLLAFHSIPMKDIENGDTYPEQVFSSGAAIASTAGAHEGAWEIGFLCRFDKSRSWLGPFVGESIDKLAASMKPGTNRLFVVTPNFSIDCLETLYDIEVELRESFSKAHPEFEPDDLVYVPCLNDSDDQVELIASIAEAAF